MTVSWTQPIEAEAAAAKWYSGSVLAHDPSATTLDLQVGPEDPPNEGRLLRLAYKAGDDFSVDTAHGEHPELNAAVSVSYDPEGQSRFELSTLDGLAGNLEDRPTSATGSSPPRSQWQAGEHRGRGLLVGAHDRRRTVGRRRLRRSRPIPITGNVATEAVMTRDFEGMTT